MGVQELWVFAIDVTGNVAGVAANAIHVPYVSKAKLSPAQVSQVDKIRMVNLSFLAGNMPYSFQARVRKIPLRDGSLGF
jgi:hypothetical protein